MDTKGYVSMLSTGLDKKITLLDKIIEANEKQLDILRDPNSLPEDLESTVDNKTSYIEEIDVLDEGFNELFDRVRPEIEKNKSLYAKEIKGMQDAIRLISDRTARIESQEARNLEIAKDKFSYIKNQIKKVSKSQKAVNTYYRNMMKVNLVDPQFMDNKK